MDTGEYLIDSSGEATSYRVDSLLAAGGRYQIAAAYDEKRERSVAVRAILYGEEISDAEVEERRAALKREWNFLQAVEDCGVAPDPYDWLEVKDSPIDEPTEPLIVCERIEGKNLYDWIIEEHPDGLHPRRALPMIAGLVDLLVMAHREKWLWRDFDPRRLIVDEDEAIRAVDIGRVIKRKMALTAGQLEINTDYVAPEIREEMTGKLQRPAADLYGVGALLSFVLTGEEPRHRVESPLSYSAYEKVQAFGLPGIELLLARLLQPLAKKRIGRAEKLRSFWELDSLPTKETKGFGMCVLPAPWLGLDIENPETNKGLRSNLSSGPLVSVASGTQPSATAAAADVEERKPNWPLIAGVAVLTAVAILLAALIGG